MMITKYYSKFEKEIYLFLWQMTTLKVLHINWKGWKYIWYFKRGSNYCRNWNRMLIFLSAQMYNWLENIWKALALQWNTSSEVGHCMCSATALIKWYCYGKAFSSGLKRFRLYSLEPISVMEMTNHKISFT